MKQEILYTYLGTNGTVTTPVHLEGIPSMVQYKLKADNKKLLTDGTVKVESITIFKDDLANWTEIDA